MKELKVKVVLSLMVIPIIIIIGCFIAGGTEWLCKSGFDSGLARFIAVFFMVFIIPFVWMADFKEIIK